jgi:hypothetical protein
MILASYRDADGVKHDGLFDTDDFYNRTFSPACEIYETIGFKLPGYGYRKKKEAARELAIRVQAALDNMVISWKELYEIGEYFETIGAKFGLLREFRANGIC